MTERLAQHVEREMGTDMRRHIARKYRRWADDEVGDLWNRVLMSAWRVTEEVEDFQSSQHLRHWVLATLKRNETWSRKMQARSRTRHYVKSTKAFGDVGEWAEASLAVFIAREGSPDHWQDQRLLRAFEALPKVRRACVEVMVFGGVGQAEAGRLLRKPAVKVDWSYNRGLEQLRSMLDGTYRDRHRRVLNLDTGRFVKVA